MDRYLKQFKKGVLEIVVLKLLSGREMYGYEIIATLGEKSQFFAMKEGTLYPILYRLEDDGLMETRWEQAPGGGRGVPKKYYTITGKGRETLADATRQWAAFSHDVAGLLDLQ